MVSQTTKARTKTETNIAPSLCRDDDRSPHRVREEQVERALLLLAGDGAAAESDGENHQQDGSQQEVELAVQEPLRGCEVRDVPHERPHQRVLVPQQFVELGGAPEGW